MKTLLITPEKYTQARDQSMIQKNPQGESPVICKTAYIHPASVIVGNVKIGKKVFVGPGAVIRADEPGSKIVIDDNCNVQDRVVIHALEKSVVQINKNTSLAHGSIIHGPCKIGKNCFIGFGSVVFDSELKNGVIVKHLAVVEKAVLSSAKVVESSQLVNNKSVCVKLKRTNKALVKFASGVVDINIKLAKGYGKKS
ncbi:MAG: hypothetical protein JW871_05475 [Endomicrobiales bacterium]|nr:hypothetical protein [Endomicrobiales bacterium]